MRYKITSQEKHTGKVLEENFFEAETEALAVQEYQKKVDGYISAVELSKKDDSVREMLDLLSADEIDFTLSVAKEGEKDKFVPLCSTFKFQQEQKPYRMIAQDAKGGYVCEVVPHIFYADSPKQAIADAMQYAKQHLQGKEITVYDEEERVVFTDNPYTAKYLNIPAEDYAYGDRERFAESLNLPHSNSPSIYVDMDGVVALWQATKTAEELFNPENHYFRTVPPVDEYIRLVKALVDAGADVCIISAADRGTIKDKFDWLRENMPFIKPENIFFAPIGADKTEFIKGNADKSILIDDYKVNLKAWKEHGGMAIKALNGVNSRPTLEQAQGFVDVGCYRTDKSEQRINFDVRGAAFGIMREYDILLGKDLDKENIVNKEPFVSEKDEAEFSNENNEKIQQDYDDD